MATAPLEHIPSTQFRVIPYTVCASNEMHMAA